MEIESSKPGKHGAAKMRITGIGIFEGQKKTLLSPGDADVEIPIIERKNVMILSVSGNSAQVMDQQSNEVYDLELPADLVSAVAPGKEATVIEAMGRKKMERVK